MGINTEALDTQAPKNNQEDDSDSENENAKKAAKERVSLIDQ